MRDDIDKNVIKRCLQQIKSHLKASGISYVDVAQLLGVSEVTVKRLLNNSDISLKKLLQLADICQLDVAKLIAESVTKPQSHFFFTPAQDEAFFQEPHLLSFFGELFQNNKTPQQIEQENHLSTVSTYKYLRKLEDLGLLTLEPDNKIKLRVKSPIGFSRDSKVLKQEISAYIQETCDVVMTETTNLDYFMLVKPLCMPESLFLKLKQDMTKVLEKYAEVAELGFENNADNPQYQVTMVGHPLTKTTFTPAKIINI